MRNKLTSLTGIATALALCMSPTMASAATAMVSQPVSPLVAVSVFGTQASAQTVCAAGTAAAAGAAAAQANPNCVLPAVDPAAPPPISDVGPVVGGGDFGISPILLALAGLALAGGIIAALTDNDDGDDRPLPVPVSPA